ncbi:MAG: Flagellar assembly protein FliH [Pseudomonadota bacterium]|jgi:flagellar assembly protein FliH
METDEQHTTTDPLRPNVRTFKPSSFQASQFEVVAEGKITTEFAAEEFAVIEGPTRIIDPMFDVYDDLVTAEREIFEEETLVVETSSFAADLDVVEVEEGERGMTAEGETEGWEEDVSSAIGESESGEESTVDDAPAEPQGEIPLVPASEIETIHQRFEEERLALQAEHERHLEEMKGALQQELEARFAAESEEKIKAVEERYRTVIDDMGSQIQQEVEALERRAVEFALQVARKLVGTIVEINPEYILQVIKDAVKLTGGATIKAIRVSPQDLEFLTMLSPDRQFKEFDGSWSFQADDTIRAGCVVETSSGEIEVDLDKTWERIKESVTKVR